MLHFEVVSVIKHQDCLVPWTTELTKEQCAEENSEDSVTARKQSN